ncbi:MAG: DUF2974 domain-containing protein [Clostridia bacterium]|nr:DUF2974 domain-containing protein [Clostridia bacterium]
MRKKYIISLIIFCFVILFSCYTVRAEEMVVTDRQIAIAMNMVYGSFDKGTTVKENLGGDGYDRKDIRDYADKHELDDWTVVDFSNNQLVNLGMTALVLEKDGHIIIAFRGTDTEFLEDALNGVINVHPQELSANIYVNNLAKEYSQKEGNYKFYVTGHSLGGYIAQTAGAELAKTCEKYSNLEVERIVDFDGMGINFFTIFGMVSQVHSSTIDKLKELGEQGKVIDYYICGDVISAAGVHYGEMRGIYPSIDTITEERENLKILDDVQKITMLSKILTTALDAADVFNAFKTEIKDAKDLYQVDSVVAYLMLTHKGEEFASLNYNESKVELKLSKKDGLSYNGIEGNQITLNKSTTLKAKTNYASVKTYKWYVSDDGKNWGEPIKVSNLYENTGEAPSNTLDIKIGDFEDGETKYYKVESYYDDKFFSSTYNYNKTKLQYEYMKNEDNPDNYNSGMKTLEFKVTRNGTASAVESLNLSTVDAGGFIQKIIDTVLGIVKDIFNKITGLIGI